MKNDSSKISFDDDALLSGISSYFVPVKGAPSWLNVVLGILEIITGFFLIMYPYWSGLASIWVAGIFFLMLGLMRLFQIFKARPQRLFWAILYIIIYIFLGLYMIMQTPEALADWTLALGIIFSVVGLSKLFLALGLRRTQGWGWVLFNGIITTLLGGIVLFGWPQTTLWLIGTLVGIEMLMAGWVSLLMGTTYPVKK